MPDELDPQDVNNDELEAANMNEVGGDGEPVEPVEGEEGVEEEDEDEDEDEMP